MQQKIEIKIALLKKCEELLTEKKVHYEHEMEETQQEANKFKGAMESRYDTFKEELQDRKNHLAVQLNQILYDINLLKKIQPLIHDTIRLSSIIETVDNLGEKSNYFIFSDFTSTPILIGGKSYKLLNLSTPLGLVFKDKKINSEIIFRDKHMKIIELF